MNEPDSAMKFVGLQISFDGTRPPIRSGAPRPSEHTQQVFQTKE